MKHKKNYQAISLGWEGFRKAALFYDRVIPLGLSMDMRNASSELAPFLPEALPKEAFSIISLVFNASGLGDAVKYLSLGLLKRIGAGDLVNVMRDVPHDEWGVESIRWLESHINFEDFDWVTPQNKVQDSKNGDSVALILSNLPSLDMEHLDFKHILKIKKDKTLINKLERLRNFFYESFQGKSISYIEDKLGICIKDYEDACRLADLEYRYTTYKLVGSESFLNASVASGICFSMGVDIQNAIGAGTVASLAGTLFEIRKQRKVNEIKLSHNSVAYVVDAGLKLK